jgi:hypothetical protein
VAQETDSLAAQRILDESARRQENSEAEFGPDFWLGILGEVLNSAFARTFMGSH